MYCLKCLHQAQHCTQQTQQRSNITDRAENVQMPFQTRNFIQARAAYGAIQFAVTALAGKDRRIEQP